MNSLEEIKSWLRIDGEDEDNILSSLLLASEQIIKQSTGVIPGDIGSDIPALELYKLIQKMIIDNLYQNRSGSPLNSLIIGLCTQLETYKLVNGEAS